VLLMDGVMFMHNKRLEMMKAVIARGDLGKVDRLVSSFSFAGDDDFFANNIRCQKAMEPLGALGDLGWYNVRLSLWLYDYELPTEVSMHTHRQTACGVPTDCTCVLRFAGNRLSTFDNSFHHALRQRAEIVGSGATLVIEDFCVPEGVEKSAFEVSSRTVTDRAIGFPVEKREGHVADNVNQHVNMLQNFGELVSDASKQGEYTAWAQYGLKTQSVIDALMESATKNGAFVACKAV